MQIAEAAKAVMETTGIEMTIDEIYDKIIERGLFKFEAQNPKSVLSRTIRMKSNASPKPGKILFKMTKPGTYMLAD